MDKMLRISSGTHRRLMSLKKYALSQGYDITIKSIVAEAVNCMPKVFFKKVKGTK